MTTLNSMILLPSISTRTVAQMSERTLQLVSHSEAVHSIAYMRTTCLNTSAPKATTGHSFEILQRSTGFSSRAGQFTESLLTGIPPGYGMTPDIPEASDLRPSPSSTSKRTENRSE